MIRKQYNFEGSYLSNFFVSFTTAFTTMVVFLALSGVIFPLDEQPHETFLTSEGMTYATLLQIAGFCATIGLLRILFLSPLLFKNMLLLWRTALLFVTLLVVAAGFIFLFGWFPIDSAEGWLGLFGGITTSGGIVLLVLWLRLRGKNTEYDELLKQYKQKKK